MIKKRVFLPPTLGEKKVLVPTIDYSKFNNTYPNALKTVCLNKDGTFNKESKPDFDKFDAAFYWEVRGNTVGFIIFGCALVLILLMLGTI